MKEPLRKKFLKFAFVGGIGSVITISLTFIFTQYFHWWYIFSLIMATLVAMMSNDDGQCRTQNKETAL